MKPIVTTQAMRDLDVSSGIDESVLIRRAAWNVARIAQHMLGGTYGRRVCVIAGPGNNGNDGRVCAQLLAERGVKVDVVAPNVTEIYNVDLVVDAAYGTGFHGEYRSPECGGIPVLAVDIPSGVSGDTGERSIDAVQATRTVTFAAYKPGHFLGDGPAACGVTTLTDIGIDASDATMWHIEESDVRKSIPHRRRHAHKWNAAVTMVAGSATMMGAAELVARGAMRSGAGMVHAVTPGSEDGLHVGVTEVVELTSTYDNVVEVVLDDLTRTDTVVIGPGLGRGEVIEERVRKLVALVDVPIVVDGDGLYALRDIAQWESMLRARHAPTVLTPHQGEFARLGFRGNPLDNLRELARTTSATVLLKGPTTLIAGPDETIRFVTEGDARLATAGTGDVLAGVIGSFLSQGMEAPIAAASAAYVHGKAAQRGPCRGLIASDLPDLIAQELSEWDENELEETSCLM